MAGSFFLVGCTQSGPAVSATPAPQSLDAYYADLLAQCDARTNDFGIPGAKACCEQSVENLRKLKFPATDARDCPAGSFLVAPRCPGSYGYCQPDAAVSPVASKSAGVGMANPAAVHCVNLGYENKIVDEPEGQSGVCVFPDGSSCDDWAFFRGDCGRAFSACAKAGGNLGATLMGPNGPVTSNSTCAFDDGTVCEEADLAAGTCRKGQAAA
ncbi:MAG TPA: DUF333 domain-containing protein [Candidatus Norongarragalinales archaeon]|nr:DUF333 domain-containing protein [Candidatus Norongarragalinales archaeon]